MQYDVLIVGAGLYGAVTARELLDAGRKVLVVDRRSCVGGNAATEELEGIQVHRYGAHIFHTNDRRAWDYVNRFADFNRFTNSPIANYRGELYSLPFNMYTFNRMWGVVTPEEAAAVLERQRGEISGEPRNLEEQAIRLVGRDVYEKLVRELPAFIIRRLPVRLTYDNNYFDALWQGIPVGGYTRMIRRMLEGSDICLDTDYLEQRGELDALAERIVYTGPIDAFYGFCYGNLAYRSLRFETELLDCPNYQGNAVVNYTDRETPWTRIIEHKWFSFGRDEAGNEQQKTVITREYSCEWKPGDEPYYPVNDEKNAELYRRYRLLADREEKVLFGGRLGSYRYYDMDQVILSALSAAESLLGE